MALKHSIDKIEDVAEPLRGYYESAQDGKYYLQVEGMVPKAKLDEFRDNNIKLTQKVSEYETKFKDVDVDKYRQLLTAQGKTPDEIEAAVQARIKPLLEERDTMVSELQTKLNATTGQLETVLVDATLKAEAAKAGVLPTAIDDVVLRGRMVYHMKDGKVIAQNSDGQPMYDKDGSSPMAVTTWMKDLKKNAPHLFQGMQGAGGNGAGGRMGANGLPANATATQKISAGLREMTAGAHGNVAME